MTSHPNLLSASDSVLIVVDLQSKLSAVMPETEAKLMINHTGTLLEASRLLTIPVLLTEQYPKGLGVTEPSITLKCPDTTQIFEKTGFSCCAADGFLTALAATQRKQVILVGQEAHVCILQTALDLQHNGYHVYVVEDAMSSRKAEHKFYALQRLQQHDVTLTNHESVLFEWLRDSTHTNFRQISALLS